MVDKKVKKKVEKKALTKKTKPVTKERRRKYKKKSKNTHQCYYKIKGRYMTPKQAARARRKRRFGKPG